MDVNFFYLLYKENLLGVVAKLKCFSIAFFEDILINYYLQEEQEPDKVLDIFIRTNSGGTPLSFSDLLMSIASANWKTIDARKEIEKLVEEVYDIGRPGFLIDKDFVLKTCLVLFIDNIKFQLKNFTFANVQLFEQNWDNVKKSIVAAFSLIESLGFNDKTFRAKNAAIPIIYYIYHKGLADMPCGFVDDPEGDVADEEVDSGVSG